jgi:chromosomal replication initiation ATPase DnaA
MKKITCIYFISDGNYIKIGQAKDLQNRITGMQTENPRELFVTARIEVLETQLNVEERNAHNFFKKYRLKNDFNREWFNKEMEPLIEEYVKNRNGKMVDRALEIYNRTQKKTKDRWTRNTVYGIEDFDRTRPRCFFYPDEPAQIIGRAGPGEKYRSMAWQGKKVYISQKKHKENMLMKREFKYEYGIE